MNEGVALPQKEHSRQVGQGADPIMGRITLGRSIAQLQAVL